MPRKKKGLQKRLAKRTHGEWARWYVENHWEELEGILKRRYGLELQFNQKEKIKFIRQILVAFWKMISVTLFYNNEEIYWSRYTEEKKQQLVFAFIVDGLNRATRIQYEKDYAKRKESNKTRLAGDNESPDTKG